MNVFRIVCTFREVFSFFLFCLSRCNERIAVDYALQLEDEVTLRRVSSPFVAVFFLDVSSLNTIQ